MSRLPLALDPEPDETWHSYLTRRAAQHSCTVTELADHIGLRIDGRWPAYHGVILDPGRTDAVAPVLGLTPAQVQDTHLASYDQRAFDLASLRGTPGIDTTRKTVQRSWVHLAGSSYCPACLAVDGSWRLAWRIPWITACLEHQVRLVGTCPACGMVPGVGNILGASAPSRVYAAPDGRLCAHPGKDGGTCGADLSLTEAGAAPRPELDRASSLLSMMNGDRGSVAGRTHTSLQTLRAWQSAIGLAVHLAVVTLPGWGRTHRWGTPPRDPATVAALLETVAPVIEADAIEAAADVIEAWCLGSGIRTPHANTFSRATQPSAALQPVLDEVLRRHGRAHTRLQRQLTDPTGRELLRLDWAPDDVPQLIWPCALPPRWRHSAKPDQRILRTVVAMMLARMHTNQDWVRAGAVLGIPPDKARNWTRYAFAGQFGDLRTELIRAAAQAAQHMTLQPVRHTWARRPVISGYGPQALHGAQQPACQREDPASAWCPCTATTVPNIDPAERQGAKTWKHSAHALGTATASPSPGETGSCAKVRSR